MQTHSTTKSTPDGTVWVVPSSRRAIQREHRNLGAFHLYGYLRKAGDPCWTLLSAKQRQRFIAGFLIGGASIDIKKVLGEQ